MYELVVAIKAHEIADRVLAAECLESLLLLCNENKKVLLTEVANKLNLLVAQLQRFYILILLDRVLDPFS